MISGNTPVECSQLARDSLLSVCFAFALHHRSKDFRFVLTTAALVRTATSTKELSVEPAPVKKFYCAAPWVENLGYGVG